MIPADTLYGSQWHFSMLGRNGAEFLIHRIWNEFDGTGVNVGVYDDGVELSHFDLNDNYDASLHIAGGGATPVSVDDNHGTSVAGLIAAEANGQDTVGVAFGADLTGVNIFNPASGFYINAANPVGFFNAIRAGVRFDVTNHSWGSTPAFDASQNVNVAGSFAAQLISAYDQLVDTGRGGLGTIVVQAAGNETRQADGDGVNSSRFTITVGALHNDGHASSYSNYGASLLVSAPAGDFADERGGLGMVTTDRLGTAGYNLRANPTGNLNYTDDFGGTSAATPVTSGVIALMLDANGGLGWRDVSNILAASADHTGSAIGSSTLGPRENNAWFVNEATNWNGGGMHFSEDYGYGNVNAFAAVRMAEVWSLFAPAQVSSNEVSTSTGTLNANRVIPTQGTVSYQFNVAGNVTLEHLSLTLNITHTFFSDLNIFVISPSGTEVQICDGSASLYDPNTQTDDTADFGLNWTFGLEAFRGESSAGTWTIRIEDVVAGDGGTLTNVALTAYGTTPSANDVYHYSDEFTDMRAFDATRGNLSDTDGGTDWINAAAVTGSLALNLNAGTSSTVNGGAFITVAAGTAATTRLQAMLPTTR
jgi:subtilisin-like proprotein convertase family protein